MTAPSGDGGRTARGLELVLPSRRVPAPAAVAVARRAESRGWLGFWATEVLALDALVLLGAVAASTQRVRLGTAIVPISTRSAALLAMAASTIAQLAPGRLSLGLGVSTPAIVDRRHDRPVERPLADARGVLEVVGRALRGERVDHEEHPSVENLRVEAPEVPPRLLLGALGPRMLDVAYELADGVVLNLLPLETVKEQAAEGRRRRGDEFETVVMVRVCIDPTADDLSAITRELASYCRVDAYAGNFQRLGWDLEDVQAAADLDEAAAALPTSMVVELAVTGSAQDCRDRLAAFAGAGVTPLVMPVGRDESLGRVLNELDPTL